MLTQGLNTRYVYVCSSSSRSSQYLIVVDLCTHTLTHTQTILLMFLKSSYMAVVLKNIGYKPGRVAAYTPSAFD